MQLQKSGLKIGIGWVGLGQFLSPLLWVGLGWV